MLFFAKSFSVLLYSWNLLYSKLFLLCTDTYSATGMTDKLLTDKMTDKMFIQWQKLLLIKPL